MTFIQNSSDILVSYSPENHHISAKFFLH